MPCLICSAIVLPPFGLISVTTSFALSALSIIHQDRSRAHFFLQKMIRNLRLLRFIGVEAQTRVQKGARCSPVQYLAGTQLCALNSNGDAISCRVRPRRT